MFNNSEGTIRDTFSVGKGISKVSIRTNNGVPEYKGYTDSSYIPFYNINDTLQAANTTWSSTKIASLLGSGGVSTGNLTEGTSSILTIVGGTGAVVGSGTSIQVKQASSTVSGYLSYTDWVTFNGKLSSYTETDPVFVASQAHNITSSHITILGNTSNTNTGDETASTIKTKLGITTLSGSNTGDETASTIKTKLGITTLSGSNTGDETASTIKTALGITTLSGSNTGDETASTIETKLSVSATNVTALSNLTGTNSGDETKSTIETKLGTDLTNKLDYNGNGSSLTGLTKTQVGLSNVDNISINAQNVIVKDPTGFTNNSAITVTHNATNRTITLTGTFAAYWQGTLISALTNGWVSPAYGVGLTANQYLYYDGANFIWSPTVWTFDMLQISGVDYDPSNSKFIGTVETHGFMPNTVHKELHENIGTHNEAGGGLSSYTLASTTAINRRPLVATMTLGDEDISIPVNPIISQTNTYSKISLTGAGSTSIALSTSDIAYLSGNQPYYNLFTGGNWTQALLPSNAYSSIWLVAIPVSSDASSQAYRYLWMQGQTQSTTLATIQAETTSGLNLTALSNMFLEYVIIGRVIIRYATSNWTLIQVDVLTGNRFNQAITPSGNYLSIVSHDTTLTGSGSVSDPLGAVVGNLTEATSNILTVTGGTGSVIGSGTSIQVKQASTSQSGYLTSTDWNTFNGKLSSYTETDPVFVASQAHNITAGMITILGNTSGTNTGDETTGTIETKLGISATNVTAVSNLTGTNSGDETASTIKTKLGITTLSGSNTGDETQSSIQTKLGTASTSTSGYLTSTDWNTFNGKGAPLGYTPVNIAGDNMTGDLTITKATPFIIANSTTGTTSAVQFKENSVAKGSVSYAPSISAFRIANVSGTGGIVSLPDAGGIKYSGDNGTNYYNVVHEGAGANLIGNLTVSKSNAALIADATSGSDSALYVREATVNKGRFAHSSSGALTFLENSVSTSQIKMMDDGRFLYTPDAGAHNYDIYHAGNMSNVYNPRFITKTHADSPYSVVSTIDLTMVDSTAGTVSIVLPATGTMKKVKWIAGTNTVTVTVASSGTIDGSTSFILSKLNDCVDFLETASGVWRVI